MEWTINFPLYDVPDTVERLKVTCYFEKIPYFPSNLKVLICPNIGLKTLENVPKSVEVIVCNDNQLTTLPPNLDKLRFLDCSRNQIDELHYYPNLISLICSDNPIHCLPLVSNRLDYLNCDNTCISILPHFEGPIRKISCINCKLLFHPAIKSNPIICSDMNPYLKCKNLYLTEGEFMKISIQNVSKYRLYIAKRNIFELRDLIQRKYEMGCDVKKDVQELRFKELDVSSYN